MTKDHLWETALAQIQLDISEANFNTWFKGTNISTLSNNKAVIAVPNAFAREWIESKYHKIILKAIRELNSNIREVDYTTNSSNNNFFNLNKKEKKKEEVINQMEFQELSIDYKTGLNPKYSFDNFIIGPFNELAHAASCAVSEAPGSIYNPLFLYSKTGLGKTHLLQAVGNKIRENIKGKIILYMPAQKLITEIISAIRSNKMEEFRYKYRDIDVLIVDDIQFLSGKEKTQEEFFHTFNDLYEKNKQIILSSDRHPKSINALTDRLRSRFEGGMIADIDFPDTETRAAILKSKAQEKGFNLADDVCYYVAENIQRSIRELEGVLNKLIIQEKTTKKQINIDTVKIILKNINKISSISLTFDKILKTVSLFYDISEKEIIGSSRKKEIIKSRQVVIYFLRKELKYSYPYIAKKLGGKDHTTIIHSFSKIEKEIEKNNDIKEEISYIKEKLITN
jgi:chromosomal replication initiator protein